jgi:hypothetical protein
VGDIPIIGGQAQLKLTIAMVCTSCFPVVKPAVSVYKGDSICPDCLQAIKLKEKEESEGDNET